MGKHRSRLKILAHILSVISANNGAKKTQIMYQAYLSYKLLVQYLNNVTEAGLVTCEKEKYYKLTKKGETFLTKFVEYDKSREQIARQLDHIGNQRLLLDTMCPNLEVRNVPLNNLEKGIKSKTEKD